MLTKAGFRILFVDKGHGRPTKCVIKGYCSTHVFEFPNVKLQSKTNIEPLTISEEGSSKATIVSNLKSYFQMHSPFRHYSICCSLRSKVEVATHEDKSPVFVVIEQEKTCETTMDDGTCLIVDEKLIEEGRPGKTALVACKTSDGAWPEEQNINEFINVVLAAVKIEQDVKDHIRELFSASCFYDTNGRAVYPIEPTFNAHLSVLSPASTDELRAKADRLQTLISNFEEDKRKNGPAISQLISALRLEKNRDDYYRCIWYLCLFEAMYRKLTRDKKQDFNQRHRDYRKKIAHPDASTRMDINRFNDLQTDVIAELRRIYLNPGSSR